MYEIKNGFHLKLVPLMHLKCIIPVLVREIFLMQHPENPLSHIFKGDTPNSHTQSILLCQSAAIYMSRKKGT